MGGPEGKVFQIVQNASKRSKKFFGEPFDVLKTLQEGIFQKNVSNGIFRKNEQKKYFFAVYPCKMKSKKRPIFSPNCPSWVPWTVNNKFESMLIFQFMKNWWNCSKKHQFQRFSGNQQRPDFLVVFFLQANFVLLFYVFLLEF